MLRNLVLALLTCACPLLAQTSKTLTAPPGFLNKPAYGWTGLFGYYLNGSRTQFADPSLAKSKMVLTELAYRNGFGMRWTAEEAMGRTFTKSSLFLAHTNSKTFGDNFGKNYKDKGVLVFSGKLTLPTLTGKTAPHTWGGAVKIPFAAPFPYNGSDDLLMDWDLRGGTLANGSTAGSKNYVMECASWLWIRCICPEALAGDSGWLPASPFDSSKTQCQDSAAVRSVGAYAYASANLYADNHPATNLRGRIHLTDAFSAGTAPGNDVIAALTVSGNNKGVVIPGAKCQPLFVNMNFVLAMQRRKAANTQAARTPNFFTTSPIPYRKAYVGAVLYFQAAWADSTTNQLGLTAASRLSLPSNQNHAAGKVLVEYVFNGKTWRFADASTQQNLVERFRRK